MFCETTVSVSRRVVSLMYGNGVSVSDAVKLHKACNFAWKKCHSYAYVLMVLPVGYGGSH